MDYFSVENNRLCGDSRALALEHLLSTPKPLIFALFSALGRSLVFLSDAIEIQNSVLVVEALTLAAVDWDKRIVDILTHPKLQTTATELLSPTAIINQLAYDGRFSGLMKSGPGYQGLGHVLSSLDAKAGVLDSVHKLDTRDVPRLLGQMSRLSVLMLCASHKAGQPAFDYYLASIPTLVHSLVVQLASFNDIEYQTVLIRGTWLLIVLVYITQLRPRLDPTLITSAGEMDGVTGHDQALKDFRQHPVTLEGRYLDVQYLRCFRSILELARVSPTDKLLYYQAARKLEKQWSRWIGRGGATREATLNITI
jgi:hypothetical protein